MNCTDEFFGFQCFRLDKFQPHPTEEDLISNAMLLMANNTFWAGKVDIGPPALILYAVRLTVY